MRRNSMQNMYSTTCGNMKYMSFIGDFSIYEFFRKENNHVNIQSKLFNDWYSKICTGDKCNAHVIYECILKRDGVLMSCLSPCEINTIIHNLCEY
jgi:hypothetical protein